MDHPELLPVDVHIEARSPLAFPTRKPGAQFRESLPYVPGAALYGALGMWYGQHHAFDPELFQQLQCRNAYPARPGDPWVRPLPMTAIQPKGAEEELGSNVLRDALAARVCWEQQEPAALIYSPTDAQGRPWEAVGPQFYTAKYGKLETRRVTQRVATRVAINRQRGTAEDQRLYSFLAINEVNDGMPTSFLGTVLLPGRYERALAGLTEITHVGGRQTTGLGAVAIRSEKTRVERGEDVAGRIERLTERFKRQAELYEQLGGSRWTIEPRTIFTVNLLSDALLLDHGWLPTNELSSQALHDLTSVEATLLRAFTATAIVGGWNVQWQRPKPTAVATTMGSVFVFRASERLTDDACERLARLQLAGIGDRRNEGYGQVRICDDFHLVAPGETE